MSDIAEDLVIHLNIHAAGVGTAVGGRIHQTHMPQRSQYPAVYLINTAADEELTMGGRDVYPVVRAVFDIEVLSTGLDEANTIADQVDTALQGIRNSDWLGPTNDIQAAFLEDKDDDYVPRAAGTDDGINVVAYSATIWYVQSVYCTEWLTTLTLSDVDALTLDELTTLCL